MKLPKTLLKKLQYVKHKWEDLHYIPPTIPRHLTREGGLLGATEEYLEKKKRKDLESNN